MKRRLIIGLLAACGGIGVVPRAGMAQTPPATQPSAQEPGRPDRGLAANPSQWVGRLRTVLDSMDLTDEEKGKLKPILDKAEQDAAALGPKLENLSPREKFQQIAPLLRNLREQVASVLTPEQMGQLGQKLPLAPGGGEGAGGGMRALEAAIGQLELTGDQKTQVAQLIQETRDKIGQLREKAQSGQSIEQELGQIRDETRQKLSQILTEDQQTKLRDLIQQARDQQGGGAAPPPHSDSAPARRATSQPTETSMQAMNDPMQASAAGAEHKAPADGQVDLFSIDGPEAGASIGDVKVSQADGQSVALSSYKGHVVVIELGSMSCPQFRDRAAAMEKLKAETAGRALFILVYTRKAHPAGDKQIDRNRTDNVQVDQATKPEARKAEAEQAVQQLHITLAVTVDDMNDSIVKAVGAYPNGCIVIGKDGTISAAALGRSSSAAASD